MSRRTLGNLSAIPQVASPLLGRDGAVQHVLQLLDGSPLVTLFGVAGVGKTRLAIAVAEPAIVRFRDGIVWVDLVPVSERDGVASALMTALDIRAVRGGSRLDAIARAATDRQILLIFDNAEHVIDEVREVAASLLRRCPQLALLVTSREPLGIPDETSWLVPSLDIPEEQPPLPPHNVRKVAAVALFLDRLRRLAPEITVTDRELDDIVRICRGLDGIPLAIEFAAARVRALPIEAIAQRLDHALGFLGEEDTRRPRHVTLRAALDWSYNLLDEYERALLCRLAVFAGSFTLESAEDVCSDEALEKDSIASYLARLTDRSLVVPPDPGANEPRYRVLETVRQYALERLHELDEDEIFLERHSEHFLGIAEAAAARLRGHEQLEWHFRLRSEYTNLRAVLQRSRTKDGLTVTGLRMTAALGLWWWYFGQHLGDANTWLEHAASTGQPKDTDAALAWARSVLQAGLLAWDRAELELAASRIDAASQILDGRDAWYAALAQMLRGLVAAIAGDAKRAAESQAEARRRFEQIGDQWGPAVLTSTEASTARFFGDLPGAEETFRSAVEQLREVGDEHLVWAPLHNLGQIAAERKDAATAAAFFEEALGITLRFDDRLTACACIAGVGHAAAIGGQPLLAAELLAAAESLLERMGGGHQPQNKVMYYGVAETVLAATDEHSFKEAWDKGSGLSFEGAVALAKGRRLESVSEEQLTRREFEVAELVGRGLTNRQIAERLSISPHTAERHVERILAKLRMSSRVEIATWMVRGGTS